MSKHSLPIPAAVNRDPDAVEIIRCWVAENAQWASVNGSIYDSRSFDEEWAWGVFLADTIKHISNSIALKTGNDQAQTVQKIVEAFQNEIQKPTSTARGGHVG